MRTWLCLIALIVALGILLLAMGVTTPAQTLL